MAKLMIGTQKENENGGKKNIVTECKKSTSFSPLFSILFDAVALAVAGAGSKIDEASWEERIIANAGDE